MRQMGEVASDNMQRVGEVFGSTPTREQHVPIIDGLANNVEGRFQVNWPNRGVIDGLPDDCVAEFAGTHRRQRRSPRSSPAATSARSCWSKCYRSWLDMEHNLEAYKTGDLSMLLWNVLQSHQTRSYDQAADVLQAILNDPDHAALAERYQGFDGAEPCWDRFGAHDRGPAAPTP